MPVTTQHPDYPEFKRQRDRVMLCLKGQDAIKAAGEDFLPATTGMKKHWNTPLQDGGGMIGQLTYEGYKKRARFYAKTRQALDNIIGIIFGDSNETEDAEVVTNDGLTALQLGKEIVRDILPSGRSVLVVDAPTNGGDPYITRYDADALINWKTAENNKNKLTVAVFKESVLKPDSDEFEHDVDERYRVYRLINGVVTLSIHDDKGVVTEEPRSLALDFIPVVIIGSVDCSVDIDPIPLLPIAECCISAYQCHAEYAHARYMSAHPTPVLKAVDDKQAKVIAAAGIGSGAIWPIGELDGADAFFLETSGSGFDHLKSAVDEELRQADYLSTRLMQLGNSAESAQALQIRDDSQKTSVYTIVESVKDGLNRALRWRAAWASKPIPERLSIDVNKPSAQPEPQMITSLIAGINGDVLPRSVLYAYLRDTKMTSLSDDDISKEIEITPIVKAAALNAA